MTECKIKGKNNPTTGLLLFSQVRQHAHVNLSFDKHCFQSLFVFLFFSWFSLLSFLTDDEVPQKRRRKDEVLFDYLNEKSNRDFVNEGKRLHLEKEMFSQKTKEREAEFEFEKKKFEASQQAALDEMELKKRQLALEERKWAAETEERRKQAEQAAKKDEAMFALMQKMLERMK